MQPQESYSAPPQAFHRSIMHGLVCTQDMSVVPGVRIEDMGHKMGCNGVDNGKLWFDGAHTRLPLLCALQRSSRPRSGQ